MTTKIEIACFNKASALLAIQENIDRIELCENYSEGGLTPKIETLQKLKEISDKPVFVMVRPRGGDFVYNEKEFEVMKSELSMLKDSGADGFVFGILDENNNLNHKHNAKLIELAGELPCTLHRAFDLISDKEKAIEDTIKCGFSAILSSGDRTSAMENIEKLKLIKSQINGRISLVVGGGVRYLNAKELAKYFNFLHSACIKPDSDDIDLDELRKFINEVK